MHALPVHCIPYAGGSVGDRWRTTQLLRQLPPQDTEVRYCHGLSDEEKRELRLFSAQRRHDSLGRATVLPVTVPTTCHQVMHKKLHDLQPATLQTEFLCDVVVPCISHLNTFPFHFPRTFVANSLS